MPLLPRHRSRPVVQVATSVATTVVGFGLGATVLVLGGAGMADVPGSAAGVLGSADTVQPRTSPHDARLLRFYECSTLGFGDRATPLSALVRERDGRVHAVTFDEGWRVYTAHGARTLVAVCLRPVDEPGADVAP